MTGTPFGTASQMLLPADRALSVEDPKREKSQVLLEGYVEVAAENDEDASARTRSLTSDDLDDLRGCFDLGFGFSYDEIPELCNTLPALELCYSMNQRFRDECRHRRSPFPWPSPDESTTAAVGAVPSWRISGPGDHPKDVKARLKFWAEAVACTVRLCS